MKNILVFGHTGLIGEHLVDTFVHDPQINHIYCLGRNSPRQTHAKLSFHPWPNSVPNLKADAAFCCLGTTIKKAGTQKEFRKVDFDLCLESAKTALKAGCQSFHLVSSHGADANSSVFYLRTKGELENELQTLHFSDLHIYRPSMLLGHRHESRPLEKLMQIVAPIFSPILIGPMKNIQPIEAKKVANFMATKVHEAKPGVSIYNSGQINDAKAL